MCTMRMSKTHVTSNNQLAPASTSSISHSNENGLNRYQSRVGGGGGSDTPNISQIIVNVCYHLVLSFPFRSRLHVIKSQRERNK